MAGAVVLFLGATYAAFINLPQGDRSVEWIPLIAVTFATVPVTALLNAMEYRISGEILGHRIGFPSAFRVSVIASAVNQLPIPGAAVVRIQALRRLGSPYGKAMTATGTVALAWIGNTGVVAGLFQVYSRRWALGAAVGGVGLTLLILSYAVLRWKDQSKSPVWLMTRLILVEFGAMTLATTRFWVALYSIGFSVDISQALILAVSVVVAAATGFFPAGLGIRELIAGGLSPLVGLPAAAGILATAVSRVVSMAGFSMLAFAVLVSSRKPVVAERSDPPGPAFIPDS